MLGEIGASFQPYTVPAFAIQHLYTLCICLGARQMALDSFITHSETGALLEMPQNWQGGSRVHLTASSPPYIYLMLDFHLRA